MLTLSGQFADAGNQLDNGIKTYMKMHGDTVAGRKIEIIRKDTAARPRTWPSACRRSWWCATASTSSPATCSRPTRWRRATFRRGEEVHGGDERRHLGGVTKSPT